MTTLIQRADASAEEAGLAVSQDVAAPVSPDGGLPVVHDDGLPVGAYDQPRASLRADEEIAAEIRGYLRRGLKVADHEVEVQVEDGMVRLTGELARQMFVHRLLERVNGISGVVSVCSRLTARHNDAVVPFAWGFPA